MDDLMQWGVFGLRDAIRSFDPARGVKFETYCVPRIRGSMLDGLKALQWAPRDVRSRLQHYNELQDQLQMEMGCKPDEQSLSARMGISREEYAALMRDTVACSVSSLHASCSESDGEKEMRQMDVLQDAREMQAADEVQHRDLRELFMKELTKNERLVMMLYYYDELTMREIGDVMGISGTRVSQMHSEIIARLRERLAKRITHCGGRPQVTMDI